MGFIWVALGGAIGSAARYGVNISAHRLMGYEFPWGTFFVNVVGSFAMGFLAAFLNAKFAEQHDLRLFLTTGILGGFTTFSAFSLDFFGAVQRGETAMGAVYVVATVLLSLVAVFAGFMVAKALTA
ncbi:MAG: fluoride efflux transporter CrcB [Alphaproteobacteria bacterium]|nr:fluoride efflux transporter CrcB [Alphaproteobacteria bacterium]